MLLKVHPDASCGTLRLENMLVGKITEMALFGQQIREDEGVVVVIYNDSAAGMEREGSGAKEKEALEVPLEPDIEGLEEVDVVLHLSPTKAYRMREIYNEWFSDCFGYEVCISVDITLSLCAYSCTAIQDAISMAQCTPRVCTGNTCLLGSSSTSCPRQCRPSQQASYQQQPHLYCAIIMAIKSLDLCAQYWSVAANEQEGV